MAVDHEPRWLKEWGREGWRLYVRVAAPWMLILIFLSGYVWLCWPIIDWLWGLR